MDIISINNNTKIEGNNNNVTNNNNINPTKDFLEAANAVLGVVNTASDYYNRWQIYRKNKADKKESDKLYIEAHNHIRKQEYKAACFSYLKAIQLNPDNSLIHNSFAWDLALLGNDLDKALYHATCALQIEPSNPSFHDTLAEVYYQSKKYEEARQSSIEALQLGNNKYKNIIFHSYRRLGFIYIENRDYNKAIENLSYALKFRNEAGDMSCVAWLLEKLSQTYYVCKKYKDQIDCLLEILKMYPNVGSIHNSLAWTWALFYEDKKQEALYHALEAVKLDENNAMYIDTLAEAYLANGKYDFATSESSKALKIMNNEKSYQFLYIFRLGRIEYFSGNYRNAILLFNKSITINSFDEALDEALVYCYLAYSYWILNDKDNAILNIDKANQISPRWIEISKSIYTKNAQGNPW